MSEAGGIGGYRRAVARAGELRLDLNEAPREPGDAFRAALLESLATAPWRRYAEMDARTARAAAAELYGWTLEGTLVGNGSNELLLGALQAFVPRGGSFAAISPSFSMYPVMAAKLPARLAEVQLEPPRFEIRREALLDAVRAADAALLCSPNNPTGNELMPGLLAEVCALGKPVLWDAAYVEFAGVDPRELLTRHENLVVFRSFSKAWALAGMRVGTLLSSPALAARVQAELLPFAIGWPVAAALSTAAGMRDEGARIVAEVMAARNALERDLGTLAGVEFVTSSANFVLLRRVGSTGTELSAALRERGIAVRLVPELDEAGFVRCTVGTESENRQVVRALREVIDG